MNLKREFARTGFLLVVLIGLATAFFLSRRNMVWMSVGPCLLLMLAFLLLRYFRAIGNDYDSSSLLTSADEIYLMGYLFTLAAFFGVALSGSMTSSTLLSVGGVKLVTTLAGLIAMLYLKEVAQQWDLERTGPSESELLEQEIQRKARWLADDLAMLHVHLDSIVKVLDPALAKSLHEAATSTAS